jgi:photosystem II stability/assembly factor-like uncharacterized protein
MDRTQVFRVCVVVAVVSVAGCSSSHPSHVATATTTTSVPSSTTAAPPATGGSTSVGVTSTTVSAGGLLPAGFTVADLTWISDNQGWALGDAPCTHQPCTSVVHTLDGGRTWAGLPAPVAALESAPSQVACSATVPCVHGIRFADGNTGYAFGHNSLWLTADGGRTWTERSQDATDALEVAHGTAVRTTHTGTGCPPGCTYRVQTAPVGSTTWQSLPSPPLVGNGTLLAAEGSNVYLGVLLNRAGGAQNAQTQFARSTDSGAHWSTFSDPCGVTPAGGEADAVAISAAPGGVLAVACSARPSGQAGFVVVSADAGATFGPHRGNLLSAVPAGDEFLGGIAAATGQRLAVMVVADGKDSIVVTNDSGSDWTLTHSEATPAGASRPYLGFEDPTTGRASIDARTVLTTTDGGGHWTPFTFP